MDKKENYENPDWLMRETATKHLVEAGYTISKPPLIDLLAGEHNETHVWFDVMAAALQKEGKTPDRPVRIWFGIRNDGFGRRVRGDFEKVEPIPLGVETKTEERMF
jgi:hypothetical protein